MINRENSQDLKNAVNELAHHAEYYPLDKWERERIAQIACAVWNLVDQIESRIHSEEQDAY